MPLSLPFLPLREPACPPTGFAPHQRQRPPLELIAPFVGGVGRQFARALLGRWFADDPRNPLPILTRTYRPGGTSAGQCSGG